MQKMGRAASKQKVGNCFIELQVLCLC
jgi:hypothetical protein